MTLPICGDDNDGDIVVHKGESLQCKRGQWIRLTDGVIIRDDRPEGQKMLPTPIPFG